LTPHEITPLNLPLHRVKLQRATADGALQVYDPLRRKWLVLTPEEWVRQHFVAHMIHDLGYPPSMMANEVGVRLNGLQRRCDTVVWRGGGAAAPLMIVEYKAPSVEITQRVFDQIARYNMVVQAPYLIVSNGLRHFCCRVNCAESTYSFLERVPTYEEATKNRL
jgi:hypothetical protein